MKSVLPPTSVTEASTLGWPPGFVPPMFDYRDVTWTLLFSETAPGGDIAAWYYKHGTHTLLVLND